MKQPDQRELIEALLAGVLAAATIACLALIWMINQ